MEYNIVEILSKDFDWWGQVKQRISLKEEALLFKAGEIWWCSFGLNLGEEIYGKGLRFTRPVLILRKLTSNSFMGLPLTTHGKIGTWYVKTELNGVQRWAMLNQARVLDKKRLTKRIGTLDKRQFTEVKNSFVTFYSS